MFHRHTYEIVQKVLQNNKKYNLFQPNDTIIVGVSGGADSICLIDILHKISTNYEYNLNLIFAHINHGIRGESAKRDEDFVEQTALNYGYPFFCRCEDVPKFAKENKLSEEEAGRQIRYSFFQELAGENGKIATAHNQNDNAETLLMRFMRGTGLNGLCGIDFKRDNIIRPILNISREDIEKYIEENHLTHITDETNLEPIYTRNKIRLNLIPEIQNTYNPNFIETVNSNIESYKEDNSFLDEFTQEKYKSICEKHDFYYSIDLYYFNKLHSAIKRRLLILALNDFANSVGTNLNVHNKHIEAICRIALADKNSVIQVSENISAKKVYDKLHIIVKQKDIIQENQETNILNIEDNLNKDFSFNDYNFFVEIIEENEKIINTPNCIHIPIEYLPTLVMRTRRTGDVFNFDGEDHTRLSKHMITKKIPPEIRSTLPIVCSGNEVFWVVGYSSTRYKSRTGKFIKIYTKEKENKNYV